MKHNLPECAIKPLDVHQTPYINTSVEEGTWNYVDQKVQNAQKEIIFSVENTEYLDLSSMQLYASVNIFPINKQNPNVTAEITTLTDSVAPINNLLHSLWEKISLKCGTVELDNPTSSYAYKDYFLKLLNYGHEEKTTLFSSSLFYGKNLWVGKNQRPYTYTLDLDFSTNHYLNGYMTLFDLSNKTNLGNNITREDYPNGYCLYGFNLEPILNCSGDFVSVSKEEEVTIKITFKTQPDETSLDLICYIEYDKIIEFDKDKKVIEWIQFKLMKYLRSIHILKEFTREQEHLMSCQRE